MSVDKTGEVTEELASRVDDDEIDRVVDEEITELTGTPCDSATMSVVEPDGDGLGGEVSSVSAVVPCPMDTSLCDDVAAGDGDDLCSERLLRGGGCLSVSSLVSFQSDTGYHTPLFEEEFDGTGDDESAIANSNR